MRNVAFVFNILHPYYANINMHCFGPLISSYTQHFPASFHFLPIIVSSHDTIQSRAEKQCSILNNLKISDIISFGFAGIDTLVAIPKINYDIRSHTTISTPHKGSKLAELVELYRDRMRIDYLDRSLQFSGIGFTSLREFSATNISLIRENTNKLDKVSKIKV
jgi:hypothetical protein